MKFSPLIIGLGCGLVSLALVWVIKLKVHQPVALSQPQALSKSPAAPASLSSSSQKQATVARFERLRLDSSGLEGEKKMLDFLSSLSKEDFPQVLKAALSDDPTRNTLIQRWADIDPQGCWTELSSLPFQRLQEADPIGESCGILFRSWAKIDPDTAMATARPASRRAEFASAKWSVISALLEVNPQKGFELASKEDGLRSYERMSPSLWRSNPEAFLNGWKLLVPGSSADAQIGFTGASAISDWAKQDFAKALAWAQKQAPEHRAALLPAVIDELAKKTPEEARLLCEALPPGPVLERAGPKVVEALAAHDPEAALAWAETHLQGSRPDATSAITRSIAQKDINQVRDFVEKLSPGSSKDEALVQLAKSWSKQDLSASWSYLISQPEAQSRDKALNKVAVEWLNQNPSEFIASIPAIPSASISPEMVWPISKGLSEQSVEQVATWFKRLPEGQGHRYYLHLLGEWQDQGRTEDLDKLATALSDSLTPERR